MRYKLDDRIRRRLKEMDKIFRDGTSTEFDRGYNQGINDAVKFMFEKHTPKDMIKEIKAYQKKHKKEV